MTESVPRQPWYRPIRARRPDEAHRVATPLELLFDLCFVAAVAQAGLSLESQLHEGHVAAGIIGYLSVFFAIWWAWMNFTWFASAYDSDDVLYRLVVFIQIAGSLVLAAGVSQAVAESDFTVITWGYVVMRVGTIAQWLRAAAGDPARRGTALRYAGAIAIVQVGWILRLLLPNSLGLSSFLILVLLEVAIPAWAERRSTTTYHPHHIAERYGLFTVIVLGEAVTAAALAIKVALDQAENPAPLITLAVMGVIILFALWWLYFDQESNGTGLERLSRALFWGYGHYFVFAGAAAVGAGLTTAVAYDLQHLAAGSDVPESGAHLSSAVAAGAVTAPIAVFLTTMTVLRVGALQHPKVRLVVPVAAVAVLATTFSSAPVHLAAGILVVTVAVEIVLTRSTRQPDRG